MTRLNADRENKKLYSNEHDALRVSLLWNNWLRIKTFTKQTSIFHVFRGFYEFNFLELYIYVNKTTLLMFGWKKYTSNGIWFYNLLTYLLNSSLISSFCFPKEIHDIPQETVSPASADFMAPAIVGLNLRACKS